MVAVATPERLCCGGPRTRSSFRSSALGSQLLLSSSSWRCFELACPIKPGKAWYTPVQCVAMDASYASAGDADDEIPGPPPVFDRIYVRNPYKRLGIAEDASEIELEEARSFLLNQYGRHERSREAIEDAHDRIIFDSFKVSKKTKFNLRANVKKKIDESPPWVRKLVSFVDLPTPTLVLQRAALYAAIAAWSVMTAAEAGPAFQIFVALGFCIYFLHDKSKSLSRACLLGLGTLVTGWTLGSLVMPNLPINLSQGNLELFTALNTYLFLWASCTFLK